MHQARPTALSAEDIKSFQALLRSETGEELSAERTRLIVERLLRFYRLCESAGMSARQDSTTRTREPGRPFTSRELETEATLALRTLQEHLADVEQRPSTWRWAIVSLHAALKFGLQAKLVVTEPSTQPPEHLPTLFRRVSEIMPELPQMVEVIEQLDTLRWKYLAKQLSMWPLEREALPQLCMNGLRVVERLGRTSDHTLLITLWDRLNTMDAHRPM